mmetsp:Transcript_6947/g.8415  ORF Transcript_6947/g.8415 Transcript_6947/m.8415 type:complete len:323 (+) Transcript_6947:72-1040(+)
MIRFTPKRRWGTKKTGKYAFNFSSSKKEIVDVSERSKWSEKVESRSPLRLIHNFLAVGKSGNNSKRQLEKQSNKKEKKTLKSDNSKPERVSFENDKINKQSVDEEHSSLHSETAKKIDFEALYTKKKVESWKITSRDTSPVSTREGNEDPDLFSETKTTQDSFSLNTEIEATELEEETFEDSMGEEDSIIGGGCVTDTEVELQNLQLSPLAKDNLSHCNEQVPKLDEEAKEHESLINQVDDINRRLQEIYNDSENLPSEQMELIRKETKLLLNELKILRELKKDGNKTERIDSKTKRILSRVEHFIVRYQSIRRSINLLGEL